MCMMSVCKMEGEFGSYEKVVVKPQSAEVLGDCGYAD